LKKGPADDGDKLQITDLLQKSAQHHQKASCEQIAAAIYLDAADKLVDTSSAPYYDHFLTEPKLKENNQIKLRSFVEKAANLRNDETSGNIYFFDNKVISLLIKLSCLSRQAALSVIFPNMRRNSSSAQKESQTRVSKLK